MMVKVHKIVDNPDGSADITFDFDKDFKEMVKKHYNLKRFSKKKFKRFVLEGICNGMKRSYPNYESLRVLINIFKDKYKLPKNKPLGIRMRIKFMTEHMKLFDLIDNKIFELDDKS